MGRTRQRQAGYYGQRTSNAPVRAQAATTVSQPVYLLNEVVEPVEEVVYDPQPYYYYYVY